MQPLKAQVRNGRLIVDEPTDLPEGTVVPLVIANDWDDLDDAERTELHEAIREGIEDMEAARTVDAKRPSLSYARGCESRFLRSIGVRSAFVPAMRRVRLPEKSSRA